MVMRRIMVAAISLIVLLLTAAGASAARAQRRTPPRCMPGHSRLITANTQAQVYEATEPEAFPEYLGVWGCAYGQKRPFFLGPLPYGSSSSGGGGVGHETLAGGIVAYEESSSSGALGDAPTSRNLVIVRDLRTGRVLRRIPTGVPLKPEPRYVGVGNVVSIVVKSDGAVAWIADDYERSATAHGTGLPYFDVYAADKVGTRLLATGTNIDPSSLALSTGATGINGHPSSIPGSTLYWTQGGKSESAVLN
jgi:hypothetical protein